ncbi:YceD family protein [Rubellimicrobium aerolatum]|uniref:YceD family protein n=1 Tax=Rubellimicrobium aerolatum TaxID=490979 RepID=A0ABW0S5X8_9RHOB|nr:YceD family protein [Rubellimicrobium aerolatum]MBP1804526.1 uncharacterized metal-binding protein YceD (DUF177 family) [Rubellimicrobium aerolatum]
MSDATPLPRHVLRLSEGNQRQAIAFALVPEADARAAVAAELGIPGVRKLRFEGRLSPSGRKDWRLEAHLGATVVQDCVVTLEPVTTRIEEGVDRLYMADLPEPEAAEAEVPEDDVEPLPASLDLGEVMLEALALALPAYPRAAGVELGEVVVTEPGSEALTEEKARPFASLRDAIKPRE